MNSEWTRVKVSDVCELIVDCVNKTAPHVDYLTDYRMIRTPNIKDGRISLSDCRYVTEETFVKWTRRAKVLPGDVLLTREAPMGEIGFVDFSENVFLGQRIMQYRADRRFLVPRFLFYTFLSHDLQNQFKMHEGSGSVVSHIRVPDCLKFELNLPPINEQQRIVEILGSIDDKIALNRQINQTLEAMAQALFKSWFVDFEPVRAKIAALETGEDPTQAAMRTISGKTDDELAHWQTTNPDAYAQLHATASLFPDALTESELGLVPEGWEVKPLDEIADYLNGLAMQKFPPENDDDFLPVIKIAQLNKGDTSNADRASSKIKPEYVINDGDVLFSWSGSLEVAIWCGGKGALNQHLFKVTSSQYSQWFYYHWTLHHLSRFRAIAAAKAVTMGHIQRKHLTEALCVVPDTYFLASAGQTIQNILDKTTELKIENRTLANLRDTLLPKLLSGELTVGEVDEAVAV